jgi:hypothetical protein
MSNNQELLNPNVPNFDSALLEQYKLYVGVANGMTATRIQANTFFLTINTALIGFIIGVIEFSAQKSVPWWILFVCGAGALLSISWFALLNAYRNLNSARFQIIHQIEAKLPANIYAYEWQMALNRPDRPYTRLTDIEQTVPTAFFALYFFIALVFIITSLA